MAEHILYTRKSVFSKPAAPAQAPRPDAVRSVFRLKDPGSAVTHFIGLVLAVLATPPLLIHAAGRGAGVLQLASLSVFMLSMAALYAASTAYHSFNLANGRNRILKKLDHMMIFVLIAGTYTPICTITLADAGGLGLLIKVWSVALGGILLKLLWVTHPKWLSSVLYIGMGWLCLTELSGILTHMDPRGFRWLLAGGIFYTIGGVLYALKLKKLNAMHPHFGSHEIFHLFVLAGSACQYVTMFYLV